MEPALADGFNACRLLASYEFAKSELRSVSATAKEVAELNKERIKDTNMVKPVNPHTDKVLELLKDIAKVAKNLLNANIDPILKAIGGSKSINEEMRIQGQRWMFVRLCKAKIKPAFINALSTLSKNSNPEIKDVQPFLDAVPGVEENPTLSGLNDLSDTEKEEAGLDEKIKSQPGYALWDWGWWTARCRDEFLYQLNDDSLAVKLKKLKEVWQDYQTKSAEGEGILQGTQLADSAKAGQDEASYMDKLEMKYGLDTVAGARERMETLLGHLNDNLNYYRYVLFQALPPGEQLRLLLTKAQQLQVGMFEPHVVAMNGEYLAVPLTPLGETNLATTLSDIQIHLKKASDDAMAAAEKMGENKVILPTPGVSVESRLGNCSTCEDHVEKLRDAEARQALARARLVELEAERRSALLKAEPAQLGDPVAPDPPLLRLQMEGKPLNDV